MMPTVTEAEIRHHFDALERGDAAALSQLLADDFVQEWPQSGERVRGAEACLAVRDRYPGGIPAFEVQRVTGGGDHWAVEGPIGYPDGSIYHMVAILEFRDGRIVHERDYFAAPFKAPEWRASLVERFESAPA
jgi:ketosteroid isomerase-like protein